MCIQYSYTGGGDQGAAAGLGPDREQHLAAHQGGVRQHLHHGLPVLASAAAD